MLNQGNALKGSTNHVRRSTWEDREWDMIAAELKRRHPEKRVTTYPVFSFTLEQVEDAMEEVIEQERHRSFGSFFDVKGQLWDAYARMKTSKEPLKMPTLKSRKAEKPHTIWEADEWEKIILEMHRLLPLAFHQRLATIRISDILQASQVLHPRRQRHFKAIGAFRSKALEIWDERFAAKHQRNIVEFSTGPIVEPPARKADESSSIAMAVHKAFQAPEKKERKSRVFLKDDEWLDIAREMHRQNPFAGFLTSEFNIIDLPAVRAASRVLDHDRRRDFPGTAGLQKPLVKAFKALTEEIAEAKKEAESQAQVETIEPVEQVQEPAPEVIVTSEIKLAAPQTYTQLVPPSVEFGARLLNAAQPLLTLLVAELAKQLAPDIIKALSPMMTNAIDDIKKAAKPVIAYNPPAIPTPPVQLTQQTKEVIKEAFAEKPKKPKIAILGPMGSQKDVLIRSFHEYEMTFIESGHGIKEAGAKCELFVVSNKHLTRAGKDSLRAHVTPEKVRYVEGGTSGIKHQIMAWKASKVV